MEPITPRLVARKRSAVTLDYPVMYGEIVSLNCQMRDRYPLAPLFFSTGGLAMD